MLKAFAGGFNFAHLIGLSPAAKAGRDLRNQHDEEAVAAVAASEDEECEDGEEEEAAEQDDDKSGKKGKKAKKAKKKADGAGDDDESDGEDDGEDDGTDDETEEDGEEEAKPKSAAKPGKASKPASNGQDFKRGRKAERRRIGLILSHTAAANNMGLAAKLACNTGMSSSAAIALLEATPAARGGRLDGLMAGTKTPDIHAGAPEAPSGSKAIEASWAEAFKGL